MTLNIRINEQQILSGDTSEVRKELEVLTENSSLIKKYQNNVGFSFMNFTLFDIVRKLKMEEYRSWFKKLDKEIPGLPHFLSDRDNALLIYLMGNIAFEEKEGAVVFDSMEANRFFKEKQAQIRNLCLSNNINPEADLNRVSAILTGKKYKEEEKVEKTETSEERENQRSDIDSPRSKKSSIKDILDKYGSIAFLTEERIVKLTIALNELPGKLAFSKNFLVKDPRFPQSFFSSVITTDKGDMEIRSLIIPDIKDVESSLDSKKGVHIQVVHKSEDGSYQKVFESDKIFPVKVTSSIEEELSKTTDVEPSLEKKDEEQDSDRSSTVEKEAPPDFLKKEVDRLSGENLQLQEKVEKLEKLIEVYEDEIHKRRSVKGFFKKFFG